jgi:hypothetical protein
MPAVWTLIALACTGPAADSELRLALQVVRLKPGATAFVEVALPGDEFRPAGRSGRSDLHFQRFPTQPSVNPRR